MTDEQRSVLAHVVVDPDAWYSHCVEKYGAKVAEAYLSAKVLRWKADYETAKESDNYKTRAEREVI